MSRYRNLQRPRDTAYYFSNSLFLHEAWFMNRVFCSESTQHNEVWRISTLDEQSQEKLKAGRVASARDY